MYNINEMTNSDQINALRGHLTNLLSLIDRLDPYQVAALLVDVADSEARVYSVLYESFESQHTNRLNVEVPLYSNNLLQLHDIGIG
jgi:hypothetical protein